MWNTSKGIGTLKGAEAALFAGGLLTLIDDSSVWDFEDYPMGIKAFDTLTPGQQVSALWTIARGLLRDEVEPTQHTAALEGAIATVFRQTEDRLEVGLGDTEPVLAARKTFDSEDALPLECVDFGEWQFEIDRIRDRILWDNDFDTNDLALDLPPEEADQFRELMGIPDDYALTIPEDLDQKRMTAALADIRRLCSRVAAPPE